MEAPPYPPKPECIECPYCGEYPLDAAYVRKYIDVLLALLERDAEGDDAE